MNSEAYAAWAAAVVSGGALFFTLYSFWWMYWRRGKLLVGAIKHFTAGRATTSPGDSPNTVLIGLPLTMFNVGASPLIVEEMRLESEASGLGVLQFEATEQPLWSLTEETRRDYFYLPFLLRPNEVKQANFVFTRGVSPFEFTRKAYQVRIQARLTGRQGWLTVAKIGLDFTDEERFSLYELNAGYKVYSHVRSV